MSTRREEQARAREERIKREERSAAEASHAKNRVLVELPERLRKSKEALKEHEDLFADLRALYAQRSILNDSTVLDQIGELIGAPPVLPRPTGRAVGEGCPACGPGTQTGPFCFAHNWHEGS